MAVQSCAVRVVVAGEQHINGSQSVQDFVLTDLATFTVE
jgi:hypothetical protein